MNIISIYYIYSIYGIYLIREEMMTVNQVALKQWGNSRGIRIPKSILDELGIDDSDVLQISVENNAIVLRKSFKHKTFEERLAEYNNNISVCEYDWDEPQGKEIL